MIAYRLFNYSHADIITKYTIGSSESIVGRSNLQTLYHLALRHFVYEGTK
jgi:hypothetical protein